MLQKGLKYEPVGYKLIRKPPNTNVWLFNEYVVQTNWNANSCGPELRVPLSFSSFNRTFDPT